METFSKDELYTIAKKSNVRDLLNLCLTNKRFNQIVCNNPYIWTFLLKRDFDFNYVGSKNPKNLYLGILEELSKYYEELNIDMPKTFTQNEIYQIFEKVEPLHLYFTAAKFGAIFIMKSMENTDNLFRNYEDALDDFIMDMDMSSLEHLLSRGPDLGVVTALETVIEEGDIEKAKLILKYYEITKVGKLK